MARGLGRFLQRGRSEFLGRGTVSGRSAAASSATSRSSSIVSSTLPGWNNVCAICAFRSNPFQIALRDSEVEWTKVFLHAVRRALCMPTTSGLPPVAVVDVGPLLLWPGDTALVPTAWHRRVRSQDFLLGRAGGAAGGARASPLRTLLRRSPRVAWIGPNLGPDKAELGPMLANWSKPNFCRCSPLVPHRRDVAVELT